MDTETLRGLVAAELFVEIAHGDAEHRAWLYDALLKSPTIEALLERVRVLEEALRPFEALANEVLAVAKAMNTTPDCVAKACQWSDLLAALAALSKEPRT